MHFVYEMLLSNIIYKLGLLKIAGICLWKSLEATTQST
jgi:hypothetical protein